MAVKKTRSFSSFVIFFIIILKRALTGRDAKFLARIPPAWAPVVARHVKGVFVNRRYKKGEPFLLKMVLIKREGKGLEPWAEPHHIKLRWALPPPPPHRWCPHSWLPWANPLYLILPKGMIYRIMALVRIYNTPLVWIRRTWIRGHCVTLLRH